MKHVSFLPSLGNGSTKTNIKMKTKYKRLWLKLYSLNTNWHLSHLTRFSFLFHDSSTVNLKSCWKKYKFENVVKTEMQCITWINPLHCITWINPLHCRIWNDLNPMQFEWQFYTSKCLFIIVSQKIIVHIHISCILTNKQDFFNSITVKSLILLFCTITNLFLNLFLRSKEGYTCAV